MKAVNYLLIMCSLLVVSGCTGNGPKFVDYKEADSATIEGDMANVLKVLFSDSANLAIGMIDGVPVRSLPRTYYLSSGEHNLTVYSNTGNDSAGGYIDVDLKSKNKYKLIAKSGEEFFTILLYNITNDEKRVLVKEYKKKANGHQ